VKRFIAILLMATVITSTGLSQAAEAAFHSYPRAQMRQGESIQFNAPVLPPLAHTRFCMQYPQDCKASKLAFRGGPIKLTAQRWKEIVAVNARVNRAIRPEANTQGVMAERWLISPASGDCNDYAVTKRHMLLALGWPPRTTLLAEVVTTRGEHHLVLVARTQSGDLVIDNLNANIRPWLTTGYRWVRVQSPHNPQFWATIAMPSLKHATKLSGRGSVVRIAS
jgi:predicted transglutaminase-like cysteine proteinase